MVRSGADIFEYCKKYVMHVGYHNADFDYTMAGANLAAVDHQQGLGVLMSDNLKWFEMVEKSYRTASKNLNCISRNFLCITKDIVVPLCRSLVHPHLVYVV